MFWQYWIYLIKCMHGHPVFIWRSCCAALWVQHVKRNVGKRKHFKSNFFFFRGLKASTHPQTHTCTLAGSKRKQKYKNSIKQIGKSLAFSLEFVAFNPYCETCFSLKKNWGETRRKENISHFWDPTYFWDMTCVPWAQYISFLQTAQIPDSAT